MMSIISVIGLVLIVAGGIILLYEEGEKDYKNPELIKVAAIGAVVGALLMGIGAALQCYGSQQYYMSIAS